MRESLSGTSVRTSTPAVLALWTAGLLSGVLALAAVVDQASIHGLREYSAAMYAPYGVPANPGALYGILYAVAVLGVLLWLPAVLAARKGRRWAPVVTVVAVVITGGLALTVFATAEYGETIYPPVWGLLALLPVLAGAVGAVFLFRRK